MGPSHFRWHLLNEIDASGYDQLDPWTEMKDAVIDASQSYKATVCDYVLEELNQIEGLECVPNAILQILLDPHNYKGISFIKEFAQFFVKPARESLKINGVVYRFRAFKNHDKWRVEDDTEKYKEQFELAKKLINTAKY